MVISLDDAFRYPYYMRAGRRLCRRAVHGEKRGCKNQI